MSCNSVLLAIFSVLLLFVCVSFATTDSDLLTGGGSTQAGYHNYHSTTGDPFGTQTQTLSLSSSSSGPCETCLDVTAKMTSGFQLTATLGLLDIREYLPRGVLSRIVMPSRIQTTNSTFGYGTVYTLTGDLLDTYKYLNICGQIQANFTLFNKGGTYKIFGQRYTINKFMPPILFTWNISNWTPVSNDTTLELTYAGMNAPRIGFNQYYTIISSPSSSLYWNVMKTLPDPAQSFYALNVSGLFLTRAQVDNEIINTTYPDTQNARLLYRTPEDVLTQSSIFAYQYMQNASGSSYSAGVFYYFDFDENYQPGINTTSNNTNSGLSSKNKTIIIAVVVTVVAVVILYIIVSILLCIFSGFDSWMTCNLVIFCCCFYILAALGSN